MRRVLALFLSLLLLAVPAVVTAEGTDAPAPAEETEFVESDAAHGEFSAGEFRHRVLPQAVTLIRVALVRTNTSDNNESSFDHFSASVSADTDFTLTRANGEVVLQGTAGQPVDLVGSSLGYTASHGGTVYGPFRETLSLKSAGEMVNVTFATRVYPGTSSKLLKYRGGLELRPGVQAASFRIINVVSLDHYLRGLAELPTFWSMEALKAQAVAARSYAAMRIGTPAAITRGFDIYDSTLSQVYHGALRENAKQDQAGAETQGLVVTYNQQVADCYYSSSSGGHTESIQYWTAPSPDQFPGTTIIPYLTGKYDSIPATPDLDLMTEEGVRTFYSSVYPEHFDSTATSANPYYRWTYSWTRTNLESILNQFLRMYGNTGWVRPAFGASQSIGTLQDIRVEGRGTSGKALNLVIVGSNGTWKVTREYHIRWILRPNASLTLRSANFFLDITRDETGAITTVKATGGGFGHGVGMDQYGVRGMANKGYGFADILYHYYTGAKVSTYPLRVQRLEGVPMDKAFYQQFYSPGDGTLEVTMNGLKNLQAVVNGHMVTVNAADCTAGSCQVDISDLLQPGVNEIVYVPVGAPEGSAVVTVAVR